MKLRQNPLFFKILLVLFFGMLVQSQSIAYERLVQKALKGRGPEVCRRVKIVALAEAQKLCGEYPILFGQALTHYKCREEGAYTLAESNVRCLKPSLPPGWYGFSQFQGKFESYLFQQTGGFQRVPGRGDSFHSLCNHLGLRCREVINHRGKKMYCSANPRNGSYLAFCW